MEPQTEPNGTAKPGEDDSKKARRTRWGAIASDQPPSSSPAAPVAAAGAFPSSLSVSLQAAASAARQALEKAKRAAMIQKQIQEQLKACQGLEASQRPRGPAAAAAELTGEKAASVSAASSAIAVAQATALAAAAKAKRDQLLDAPTLRASWPASGAGDTVGTGREEPTAGGTQPLTLRALLGAAESGQEVSRPSPAGDAMPADPRQRQLFLLLHDQQLKKQEAEEAERLKQEKLAAVLKARPRPLRFDKFGREVDEEGKVVPLQKRTIVSDLKINRRAQNEGKIEETAKALGAAGAREAVVEDISEQPWFDPSIPVKTARNKRKRKAFEFVEAGRYIQQEQQMLHHQHMMEKKAERERERGEDQRARGRPGVPVEGAKADGPAKEEDKSPVASEEETTPDFLAKAWDALDNLVEHPVPVKPAIDAAANVIINMYLTKQERKKLRRRKRQEKEREKQDKIRMGLMPPPPPKVKLTNLMRVLGDQAVADPSKVEKEVREQMEKRLKDHEARNEARKLAPEVRSKKHAAKWQVDINAQQLHLAGVAVICPSSLKTIVLVEGSLVSIKRFRSLMLRRIKWRELEGSSAVDDDEDEEDAKPDVDDESCCLVWQGTVRTNSFSGWKIHRVAGEADGKKIFKLAHVEHYWDMAQKFRPVSNDL
ncbi:Similar to uniprot/Q03338 Saccharomyces cerevisiae YDR473c essential splicing factor, related [Neospora caninum Liverpool]|uniref:Similar to uniprot/Q03338 Saccharomyces cerevisiae YDR473c essential splicing factor, related n=1 Tax=Neospora caninum (strain Liverpool) TaxID=572307 RepID=F0VPL2_NEOCL|nr:Similar to uniprot/Q03338 Saccharomyces cerevisiae YDR473c essential splicing factor, related [Neospora caninum Liverpool]CBZ55659.1 Similar to uniprot/Q03338 Saccharomyces cerevisiae YDR473c essential splicing factor, related [Neospora caninum Liverpool]|eukprot:XP_003885685.1 Similar to uniprot/Q03338 Saccharomyces cerevisiae YDR473c essential splicing factor, related [Neospora caninum Liverpool]